MRKLLLVAQFVGHQVLSTLLVPALVGFAVIEFFSIAHSAGSWLQVSMASSLLTENHVFALQWANALLLGYVLHGKIRQWVMKWVWVLPTLWLLFAILEWKHGSVLDSTASSLSSRISHFFGNGCDIHRRCFDQFLSTLPFYCAVAYSVGAWLQSLGVAKIALPGTAEEQGSSLT